MRIEHLGIAVRSATDAAALYERLLGLRPYKAEVVASEGVRTVFLDAGGAKLEWLEATAPDSPVARHVERRGEGLHHVAFEVDDVEAEFARLQRVGVRLLNEAPKRGADGKMIFFVHPKDAGGVLLEFCQWVPPPLEPRFARLGEGRVAYYLGAHEDAPPLVVLHGAGGSAEGEARRLLPLLEPHARTVTLDLPGHGRSTASSEEPLTPAPAADAALAVLDHLDVPQADVLGIGGAAALGLAHHAPARVRRVVVHDVRAAPEEHWLGAISAPTLVSASEEGVEPALALWRALPDARLSILPRTDGPLDAEAVGRAVVGFLSEP